MGATVSFHGESAGHWVASGVQIVRSVEPSRLMAWLALAVTLNPVGTFEYLNSPTARRAAVQPVDVVLAWFRATTV